MGKVGEVVGEMRGFESTSGLALLTGLTEALCDLSCLEDVAGREVFAHVLGDQLGVRVTVRGRRLREDVVALVRAALSVPGGEGILTAVVDLMEGAPAAARVERVLTAVLGLAEPLPSWHGPLSDAEVRAARQLLGEAAREVSWTALRDGLAEDIGLDLPHGLSPEQLLTHVLEWNVQPDGLPPAVLMMDHAASSAEAPGHRGALSAWAEDWARGAGLLKELEQRRATRAAARADPAVPACLVVVVEPADDGSQDIVVRPWLNTVPGQWYPLPAEPETTTLDRLGTAVERALRQMARLSPSSSGPSAGVPAQPVYVEFVLPYALLNHDMAGLAFRTGEGSPLPLGLRYGVHLRSLERMRTPDATLLLRWRERWRALHVQGVAVHGWSEADSLPPAEWQAGLVNEPRRTAAFLDAPERGAALKVLKAAVAEGIGLAVWDRRGHFEDERREVATAVFASVSTPAQIPLAVHRLRRAAVMRQEDGGAPLFGRHIAFFWDDPHRLVDVHEPIR